MSFARHIVPALLLVCLLASCSGRPRIIPRSTMAGIYADMFLADQWLSDHPDERKRVDTMLFYDPIFKRYGYSFEDYDASVQHYLKNPEKFAKVFTAASEKLKSGRDYYRKKLDHLEMVKNFNAAIKGYSDRDFKEDTVLWRSGYKDSLRRLALVKDSLLKDSLYRDSLRLDSLVRDSLRRDSLRIEALLKSKQPRRIKRIITN